MLSHLLITRAFNDYNSVMVENSHNNNEKSVQRQLRRTFPHALGQ